MASRSVIREPSHAGSWYSSSKSQLNSQLDGWLADVETPVKYIGTQSGGETVTELPVPGARIIIGPHAGYAYSGPAAAWAYKCWDVTKAKRVFLLGPSHHFYLQRAALSQCTHYGTPLGNLPIDRDTTAELHKTGAFEMMSKSVDEDEHSLEMHLPYIYKMLTRLVKAPTHMTDQVPSENNSVHGTNLPPLVPIMVGNTSASTERQLGRLLAPYLADPSNAFVISSDFAHWGLRFHYTYYRSSPTAIAVNLRSSSKAPKDPEIHESIKAVDFECMDACESGQVDAWLDVLSKTGNTVCGRHPIGVVMAGLEAIEAKAGLEGGTGRFKFVKYDRSSEVTKVGDSSVSYCSAFAVL